VIAVAGGLVAAAAWAASALCARRTSRLLGPQAAVAWMMMVGLVVLGPLALVQGKPEELDAAAAGWVLVGGVGAVAGLVCMYAGLRVGKVGVVAPLVATEGAVAAVIAVAFGERIGLAAGVLLAVIVAGVLVAGRGSDEDGSRGAASGAWFALAAAMLFGASLYGIGRAGDDAGTVWTLVGIRLVAVVALLAPLLLLRRLYFDRAAAPFLIGSGLLEIVGGSAFIYGAGESIAVTSVVSSQHAALVVAAGYLVLGERLGKTQVLGVATVLAAVCVLAGLQA
jgi:drug/metabolite transporter (DMT)-like permease